MYNEDGSATLTLIQPQAARVEVRYRRHNYKLARPEFRHDPQFYAKDYVMEPMTKIDDKTWQIYDSSGAGISQYLFFTLTESKRSIRRGPMVMTAMISANFHRYPGRSGYSAAECAAWRDQPRNLLVGHNGSLSCLLGVYAGFLCFWQPVLSGAVSSAWRRTG